MITCAKEADNRSDGCEIEFTRTKPEPQVWLSRKLEETLPEFVAGQFQKVEAAFYGRQGNTTTGDGFIPVRAADRKRDKSRFC